MKQGDNKGEFGEFPGVFSAPPGASLVPPLLKYSVSKLHFLIVTLEK